MAIKTDNFFLKVDLDTYFACLKARYAAPIFWLWNISQKKICNKILFQFRYGRPAAKGTHQPGPKRHESEMLRAARAKILCLDRRFHPWFPFQFRQSMDHASGIQ